MEASLWAPLCDEEVAEQADLWHEAAERHERRRRYGLAHWCRGWEQRALTELADRIEARREAELLGAQLSLDVPGRVAPECR